MNDRYLFKAKRKDWKNFPKEEQWVYGYYVRGFNAFEEPIHVILDPTTVFDKDKTDGWDEIDQSTLCQCTGLKDKAGNLIWENDLALTPREDGYSLVCWNDTEARWEMHNEAEGIVLDFDNYWANEVEVVGNRFDNPELLEVER